MDVSFVLAMLLAVAPGTPLPRARPIAEAIAETATTRAEAAALLAIEMQETTMGREGVPFGLLCCRRRLRGAPLGAWAAAAARVWRAGRRACGDARGAAFFYHAGRCRQRVRGHSAAFRRAGRAADAYAERVARAVARLEAAR